MINRKILIAGMGLLIGALSLSLASCKSAKPTVTYAAKDSTYESTKLIPRDTTVVAPAAYTDFSVSLYDLNAAINTAKKGEPVTVGTSQAKQAYAVATIQDGKLKVRCGCDTVGILARLKDTYILKTRTITITKTVTPPPVEVKYIPWYVKLLAWYGGLSAVWLAIKWILAKIKSKTSLSA